MGRILGVTRGGLALRAPVDRGGSEEHSYGVAFPFQVGPRTAAVCVSLRNGGYPVGDFENGADVILFDEVGRIAEGKVTPVARNEKYVDEESGKARIIIKYPILGGFVPWGALGEDGGGHAHAGTGFGLNQALDFPMVGEGYYRKEDKTTSMVRSLEVRQFRYDGRDFRVVDKHRHTVDDPLRAAGSEWEFISAGLKQAIPDGEDLLLAVSATTNNTSGYYCYPTATGVARWRRIEGRWQPVSFVPIIESREAAEPRVVYGKAQSLDSGEASLIRDGDGSLLFTARLVGDEMEDHAVRVYRSADSGCSWDLIIDRVEARGQAPVTINQAADGTPYIVGNKFGHERDWLCIWALNEDRTGLEEPITVRNALAEFGPPPTGPVWFMDHPCGAVLRLADGQWHNVLSYRNMDRGEHAGAAATAYTGQYLEEVVSTGGAVPAWNFG